VARQPRNDDELFSDIVAREFNEVVDPTPRVAEAPPQSPAPAATPFELNLFDDDESYRHVPGGSLTKLTGIARVGLILLAFSVVGGLVLMLGAGIPPRWLGWVVALAFGIAVGIAIKQLLRKPGQDTDEDGTL